MITTIVRTCDVCNHAYDFESKAVDSHVILDTEMDVCNSCKRILKQVIEKAIEDIEQGIVLDIK